MSFTNSGKMGFIFSATLASSALDARSTFTPFWIDELLGLLVQFVPQLPLLLDPLLVDLLDGLLVGLGDGVPLVLVHDHEDRGRVREGVIDQGGLDHFGELPAFERLKGKQNAIQQPFLDRVVSLGDGHGDRARRPGR